MGFCASGESFRPEKTRDPGNEVALSRRSFSYFAFRSEKRNKHARVLAARQAPSLKKWREFPRSGKQKQLRTKYALSNFPETSNI